MRWSTLARLAVAGTKTDRVRVNLTVFGSAAAVLAWLCAATVASMGVASIGPSDPRYSTDVIAQPGLRLGTIATLVLLTIPVLGFVGQCARLGAPARDRRIAAIRLAGATPRQAITIGAGESGVAAALGSAVGLGAYFVLRHLLDHPDRLGRRALPTDVLPPVWSLVLVCLLLPLVVALISGLLLKTVTTTPLGIVARAGRRAGPSPFVGFLIIAGLCLFGGFAPFTRYLARHGVALPDWIALLIFYVGVLLAAIGVSLGAGWIAYTAGRVLRRLGRSPATQIAAGRLIADPWQGSRAFGVLLVAVLFGGGVAGVYTNFAIMEAVRRAGDYASSRANHQPPDIADLTSFYTNTVLLVGIAVAIAALVGALGLLVSLSEAIVSRRRAYASLVASGVPRSVLVRTQLWQTLSMAVPALVIAATVGVAISRALMGTSVSAGGDQFSPDHGAHIYTLPTITRTVPVPWHALGLIAGGSLAAVLVTVGIGLLFLKSSTSVEELRTT